MELLILTLCLIELLIPRKLFIPGLTALIQQQLRGKELFHLYYA